jgi:two-component system, response regulator RegA
MISLTDTPSTYSLSPQMTSALPSAGRVLVIDDDEVLLNVVGRALRAAGFQVISATSAEEGLERFMAVKPDCAVVDVYLPGLDGFAFVERARALAPEVPMLILSGLEGVDHQRKAVQVGARQFLPKAIDVRDLERHIRDAMVSARSEQAAMRTRTTPSAYVEPAPFTLPTLKLAELERAAITQALATSRGNRTQAARLLGIHVRTLHRKLREG